MKKKLWITMDEYGTILAFDKEPTFVEIDPAIVSNGTIIAEELVLGWVDKYCFEGNQIEPDSALFQVLEASRVFDSLKELEKRKVCIDITVGPGYLPNKLGPIL